VAYTDPGLSDTGISISLWRRLIAAINQNSQAQTLQPATSMPDLPKLFSAIRQTLQPVRACVKDFRK